MRLNFRLYVLIILIIVCLVPITSASDKQSLIEHIRFQYLTTNDGLTQNTVDCILKDQRGFMWFGTWNGLCRYDGYSFKTYQKGKEPLGLPDNFIHTICEDSIGNLWIGTGGGLVCFDYSKERFQNIDRLKEDLGGFSITHLLFDQRQRLWVGTQNNGLWIVDHNEKQEWRSIKIDGRLLPGRHINHLTRLNNQDLLVGTTDGIAILNLEDITKHTKWDYLKQELIGINVQAIFQDSKKLIWLGTDEGLYQFDPETEQLLYFGADNENPDDLNHLSVSDLVEDNNGTMIVGTLNGLNFYNAETKSFIHLTGIPESKENLNNPFVSSLFADDLGNVWIGTEKGGANYYNTYQKPFYSIQHNPSNNNTISYNTINSIYIEKNNLWIGTAGGGLNKLSANGEKNIRFKFDPDKNGSINNNFISALLRDRDKNMWVGTWGGGINLLLSENKNQFSILLNNPADSTSLCNNFVSSLMELDKNRILIGTRDGLDIFNPSENTFLHVHEKMRFENELEVGCLLADQKERIWVGTRNGLYRFSRNDLLEFAQKKVPIEFLKFSNNTNNPNSLAGNYVISLCETKGGIIWVGTYGNGICKYVEDSSGGHFVNYTEQEGLCNNVTYAIEQDLQGNLWISTDMGLSKFNPITETFHNYFVKDGLLSDQFYWTASDAGEDGMLYFGGVNGLNYFLPNEIEEYPNSFQPTFTEFSIFNNPVNVGEKFHTHIVLNKPVGETKRLDLSYKDAVFSIDFSALDYFLPEKIKYAYKMDGVDQDWVVAPSSRRFANYTNLSGGEYLFQVKATNSDGVWSDQVAELQIIIHPPFWQTAWFRFLSVLVAALLVMTYIHYRTKFLNEQKRKLEKQVLDRTHKIEEQKEELESQAMSLKKTNQQLAERQVLIEGQKLELEKQNEQIASQRDEVIELNKKVNLINQLRLRFFTNISHEFRTPLTLIIDPLEELMKHLKDDKNTMNTLKIINRNAQRLLHLINQLIYFRRIETGKLTLRVSKGSLPVFLNSIFESFKDLAHHQVIDYQFIIGKEPGETWFDSEKLENIFYNILSNAFKYTPPAGKISMEVSFEEHDSLEFIDLPYVCIKVIDSGKGIVKEHLPYVFDRFYQVESNKHDAEMTSSGIGLALTHEIIKALHGEIQVESEPGKGSIFKVYLPYKRDRFEAHEINQISVPIEVNLEGRIDVLSEDIHALATDFEDEDIALEDKSKPMVLIVEDNFDLRNFLLQTLRTDYRTLGAGNGKEGLAMAKKYSPELIISDVMMPLMDGIELCSRLKKDIQTSHVPIILLTAKNMVESWVEGLETGADDYIPKPFNLQILQAKMNNLIESRRKLKRMFSNPDQLSPSEVTSNAVDEEFLARACEVLEKNYAEPEFSASQFASEMFVSRSLLYKKIKAITDLNITDFINSYKLKKAIDLIKMSDRPISDIAFSVGFNDPKYFSRIFKKFYGMRPSEFSLKS